LKKKDTLLLSHAKYANDPKFVNESMESEGKCRHPTKFKKKLPALAHTKTHSISDLSVSRWRDATANAANPLQKQITLAHAH